MAAPLAVLELRASGVRAGEEVAFSDFAWSWKSGQQWAVLGPNGAGKSLLALALAGQLPLFGGEAEYGFAEPIEDAVALLTPSSHRALLEAESSFYQSRWHSGIEEGHRTVAELLSRDSVEERNPFEVTRKRAGVGKFNKSRHEFVSLLGLEPLLHRKFLHLSNGEQRKVLLCRALLRTPKFLILDDPFGGLDVSIRRRLKTAIEKLMRDGLPVLILTSRPDELPGCVTHVLLIEHASRVMQGRKAAVLKHPLARRLGRGQDDGPASKPRALIESKSETAKRDPGRALLEFQNVHIKAGNKVLFHNFDWKVQEGERWALLGPNGSGKTTLLSLVQLDHPLAYALDMKLFGQRPESTQGIWRCRQHMSWLSPELHMHYPRGWKCWQVVCSGFFNSTGLYESCTDQQRRRARKCLADVGLSFCWDWTLAEISLGDQRCVLLARALVKQPRLLILDEPCQGLDAPHRQRVMKIVDQALDGTNKSLIYVTHHPCEMPKCITNVLRLERRAGTTIWNTARSPVR